MTDNPATAWKRIAAVAICSGLLSAFPVLAERYEVGPGRTLAAIGDVPWESLTPGDEVLIHWRAEPYREKWVICRQGTAERPIQVRGVPGPDGQLPVIDGRDATTRPALNFWGEERGVIKIGGANRPADTVPAHLVLENLEIRSWLPEDWRPSHSTFAGAIRGAEHIVDGQTPGFAAFDADDFRLLPGSSCVQAGAELPQTLLERFPVARQYVPHQQTKPRRTARDLGAFERVE